MNEPRAGIPADPSFRLSTLELRVAALESKFAAQDAQAKLEEAKVRSPEEEAIREASLVRALEIAAALFPSPVKPILETLVDPDAEEEFLVCTVEWDGEAQVALKQKLEWHRQVAALPGLHICELSISIVPHHAS